MKIGRYKPPGKSQRPAPLQLQTAYAVCRGISRAAARNFYYAFLALPREKRDAICAVYAFMRHADDITDEPGLSIQERRAALSDWLMRLQRVSAGEPTDDPVLMAVADAQYRYAITPALLEMLVEGTAMDLEVNTGTSAADETNVSRALERSTEAQPRITAYSEAAVQTVPQNGLPLVQYETFAQLYNYCYRVASVVGLICIRIFGYHDPAAEPLAERCGIAFQLTNIIRDVKEDALMGRIYFPREDLDRFGVSGSELREASLNSQTPQNVRALLEFEAQRARQYYASAEELLPYIDDDSRPALWVLVTIYRKLLQKITAQDYHVLGEKVTLGFWEKFSVLARGVWQRIS
jgi:phytoene synthase